MASEAGGGGGGGKGGERERESVQLLRRKRLQNALAQCWVQKRIGEGQESMPQENAREDKLQLTVNHEFTGTRTGNLLYTIIPSMNKRKSREWNTI